MRAFLTAIAECIWAATVWLGCITAARAQELAPEDLYERLLPSVVTLSVRNTAGERFTGSGFLALEDGLAVTAWHVVRDAQTVTARFADGTRVPVLGIVDKDEGHDLALVRLNVRGRPLARLGAARPRVGSKVYVIGAPRGYGFSIADGLVSQIQEVDGYEQYQVSCPFSLGNSGGPVVNSRGEVIGIASWSKVDAQNVNFAVPVEHVGRLNPSRQLTEWRQPGPEGPSAVPAPATTSPARAEEKPSVDPDLTALRQLLKSLAGQRVTIIVPQGDGQKTFSFVVPQ